MAALESRGKLLTPWCGDEEEDLWVLWTGFWHCESAWPGPCLQRVQVFPPAQPSLAPAVWLWRSPCIQKDGAERWSPSDLYLFTSTAWHLLAVVSCLLYTLENLSYSFTSPLVISIWEIRTAAC